MKKSISPVTVLRPTDRHFRQRLVNSGKTTLSDWSSSSTLIPSWDERHEPVGFLYNLVKRLLVVYIYGKNSTGRFTVIAIIIFLFLLRISSSFCPYSCTCHVLLSAHKTGIKVLLINKANLIFLYCNRSVIFLPRICGCPSQLQPEP